MPKLLQLTFEEIEQLKAKIAAARKQQETVREKRIKAINAYYREPIGNEQEGRAKVQDSFVLNNVEGVHPYLMRRFMQSEPRVTILGPDPIVAKGLRQLCRKAMHDNGAFGLISDLLKDAEIGGNGSAKLWWKRVYETEDRTEVLTGPQIDSVRQTEGLEVVDEPQPIQRQRAEVVDDETGLSIIEVEGAQTYLTNVRHHKVVESRPVVASMPHEEFIAEPGKRTINDDKGCGHIRADIMAGQILRQHLRLSRPGKPFYRNLRQALMGEADEHRPEYDERMARESVWFDPNSEFDGNTGLNSGLTPDGLDLRKKVTVVEWYDLVVSAGKLVSAIVTFVNNEVVRAEENEDGFVGIVTWSPIHSPHSIYGNGLGFLYTDEQHIRTSLFRAVLDSAALSIDKPRVVRKRSADLLGLGQLVPGKIIVGSGDDFTDVDVGVIDQRVFSILEYMKAEGEERPGAGRYNQGTDADSLNKTATGVSLIQRAGNQKLDMMALAFSEQCLVDLWNKLIKLYQLNLDIEVQVEVDGEVITLDHDMIQGNYYAQSDLGVEVDFDDREFAKSQQLLATAVELVQVMPEAYTPEVIYEHIKALYHAAGVRSKERMPVPPSQWPSRQKALPAAAAGAVPQLPAGQVPPPPNAAPTADFVSQRAGAGQES